MSEDFKFKAGEIVFHILTKEKFLVIKRSEVDIYCQYRCRNKTYRTEEFYEFELRKVKGG